MAKLSVENYIAQKRKEGFSQDEILHKLSEDGYDNVVGLLSSHVRTYKIATVVLLLLLLVAVTLRFSETKQLIPISSQIAPVIDTANPVSCLKAEISDKEICLKDARIELEKTRINPPSPLNGSYMEYSHKITWLAALRDDALICDSLGGQPREDCIKELPGWKVVFAGDPAGCEQLPSLVAQNNCLISILSTKDQQTFVKEMSEGTVLLDKAYSEREIKRCDESRYPIFARQCKTLYLMRSATDAKDPARCADIEDSSSRTYCESLFK